MCPSPSFGDLFQDATKDQAKARVAISGPSGSGKTTTALIWARTLAGPDGVVAVIDTERGSASLYADQYQFKHLKFNPPYDPDRLVSLLEICDGNADVVIIDSGSHFWAGKGGILQQVEAESGPAMQAWNKVGTPKQQKMVDALLAFNGHIIFTMRAKTEWSLEPDDRGKIVPKKLGMAPQQRQDIEYEFTIVLEVDMAHNSKVGKTRWSEGADKTFKPNETEQAAEAFLNWLTAGEPVIDSELAASFRSSIESLTPAQRRDFSVMYKDAGLPKIELLTLSRYEIATSLLNNILSGDVSSETLGLETEAQ
jgi:DNA polymerase III delta prime subunit